MNVCEGKQEPKIKRMAEVTFDSYTHSLLMSYSCSLPFVSSLLSLIFFFFLCCFFRVSLSPSVCVLPFGESCLEVSECCRASAVRANEFMCVFQVASFFSLRGTLSWTCTIKNMLSSSPACVCVCVCVLCVVCVCVCVVTQPVALLCKTSFSGRFMALLMDTGLLGSGGNRVCVCVCVCLHTCILCVCSNGD